MIQRHVAYTRSERGAVVLDHWDAMVPRFVKVMPKDYKRILLALKNAEARGLCGEEAIMAAFEENVRDVARIGGS